MKTIGRMLLTAFALSFAPNPVLAQTTQNDDIVALAADLQSLPQVDPLEVPLVGATCWWILPGGQSVPMPFLPPDLSGGIWRIGSQQYLADETGGSVVMNPRRFGLPVGTSDTAALVVAAQVQSVVALISQVHTTAEKQQKQAIARAIGID